MASKATGKIKNKGPKQTDAPNPKGQRVMVVRIPGGVTFEWRARS